MRIGYICGFNTYPPAAGGSVHAFQVTSGLIKNGHELFGFEYEKNPSFVNFPLTKVGAINLSRNIELLYIRCDSFCYDEMYTLLKVMKCFRLPVVWEINAPVEEIYASGNHNFNKKIVRNSNIKRKILAKLVNASICVSKEMQSYSQKYLQIKNSYLVPNGSDPILFSPDKKNTEILRDYSNRFKILWAGRSEFPWQGIDIIEKLADKMWQVNRNVLFILLTDPKNIKVEGKPNLLVFNTVDYFLLPEYLNAADATLALYGDYSWCKYGFYGSSLKLFDYMSCARPVIATNLGQVGRIIKNYENGLLTDNNIDDLIKKILFLIKYPQRAKIMGENARQDIIRFYNWNRVINQTESILGNLI